MSDSKHIIAVNKYGTYAIPKDAAHRPAPQQVVNGEVYEPQTIQFILDNAGDGVIIHAGMFFGDFLPALATLPNTVYAFEPVTENFDAALKTLALNNQLDCSTIRVFQNGLGDVTEQKEILINEAGTVLGGASRYVYARGNFTEENLEQTHIVRLDDVVDVDDRNNVSILQLDIEGYEDKALAGALEIIEASSPIIIIEVWQQHLLERDFYKEEIFARGYEVVDEFHGNVVLRKN